MNRISLIAVLCAASHVLGADPKADLIQGTASAFRWELWGEERIAMLEKMIQGNSS